MNYNFSVNYYYMKITLENYHFVHSFIAILLCGFLYNSINEVIILQLKNIISYEFLIYFYFDIWIELFYFKRYLFVPHHVIGLVIFKKTLDLDIDFNLLKKFSLLLGLIEYTAVVVNIRYLLKKNNQLNKLSDFFLYLNYFFIRGCFLPYYVFYYVHDPILFWMCLSIFFMSYYWIFKWSSKLIIL